MASTRTCDSRRNTCATLMFRLRAVALAVAVAALALPARASTQSGASAGEAVAVHSIQGTVRDAKGKPLPEATVTLSQPEAASRREASTDAAGQFRLQDVKPGKYSLQADWHGRRSLAVEIDTSSEAPEGSVTLVIATDAGAVESAAKHDREGNIDFTDEPSFTIAGVTDWTAVGGHGSDANLRTSETLARQTASMQEPGAARGLPGLPPENPEANRSEWELRKAAAEQPQSFRANHELGDFLLRAGHARESIAALEAARRITPADSINAYELTLAYKLAGDLKQARSEAERLLASAPNGNAHRIMGEIDEAQGDPLGAVREFDDAARVDPNEDNYFAWGSELLLHRAIWQAKEVFERGAAAYPKSSRMITGLGASLFAGALYEEAAQRLCEASDLDPADPQPYEILGKVDAVAPDPLPCIEIRLARFAEQQPSNSEANYLYAAAILRRPQEGGNSLSMPQAEALLTKAVALDPRCGEAYLQLGILSSSRRDTTAAAALFEKAIAARPDLGDAHYRLAVAYDRLGEKDKARREFALHDEIEKQQADAVERQRHELKQFEVASQANRN